MEEQFKSFLKEKGYSEFSPSGNPSVVYDYAKRVIRVSKDEGYASLEEFAKDIDTILPKYRKGGEKENVGTKSKNAVVSALEQFRLFVSGETDIKNRRKKSLRKATEKQPSALLKEVKKIEDSAEKQRVFELKIFGITIIKWTIKES